MTEKAASTLGSAVLPVQGNRQYLLQIIINLLQNAIQFTEKGTVSFTAVLDVGSPTTDVSSLFGLRREATISRLHFVQPTGICLYLPHFPQESEQVDSSLTAASAGSTEAAEQADSFAEVFGDLNVDTGGAPKATSRSRSRSRGSCAIEPTVYEHVQHCKNLV